jgi:hypothetical protein
LDSTRLDAEHTLNEAQERYNKLEKDFNYLSYRFDAMQKQWNDHKTKCIPGTLIYFLTFQILDFIETIEGGGGRKDSYL